MENPEVTQEIKPPSASKSPIRWLKENLFSTWYNALLTCLALAFLYFVFKDVLTWVFTQANWKVIPANLQILAVGSYPIEQIWRVLIVICVLAVLTGLSVAMWWGPLSFLFGRNKERWKPWVIGGWLLSFPWTMIMLHGFGENIVHTTNWGGLLLTIILAVVGILVCFPLGALLALGRRSQLPAIRWVSIIYIETVRGVPLITILFMGSILLPIFMPGDFQLDKVLRAMVGLTLFSGAYMAENIRGGLQSIPKGQHEAAQAIGLTYPKTMLFIVLPQALRAVIPAIVGQFIALFKDTSLVTIVGLLDLLGVAKSVVANKDWLGLQTEVYLFVAVIYFVFTYAMSYASQKIEANLGVGKH